MKYLLPTLLLALPMSAYAQAPQNLIPNPGFEQHNGIPTSTSQSERCELWLKPSSGTPDYYHSDATDPSISFPLRWAEKLVLKPHTGKAMLALFTGTSVYEYITIKLKEPLQKGQTYHCSFYYANGSGKPFGCRGAVLGMMFTTKLPNIKGITALDSQKPQIASGQPLFSSDWKKFSKTFQADKDYQYLTIGSFEYEKGNRSKYLFTDNCEFQSDSYTFFDDISVVIHHENDSVELLNQANPLIANQQLDAEQQEITTPKADYTQMINDRPVSVQKQISVKSKVIKIKVNDDKTIDGDIISLNFNGDFILEKYTLRKKPITIKVSLQPDRPNYLSLFAHNLGSVAPNTANLTFKADGKKYDIELNSGMGNCGAVEIKYEP